MTFYTKEALIKLTFIFMKISKFWVNFKSSTPDATHIGDVHLKVIIKFFLILIGFKFCQVIACLFETIKKKIIEVIYHHSLKIKKNVFVTKRYYMKIITIF